MFLEFMYLEFVKTTNDLKKFDYCGELICQHVVNFSRVEKLNVYLVRFFQLMENDVDF